MLPVTAKCTILSAKTRFTFDGNLSSDVCSTKGLMLAFGEQYAQKALERYRQAGLRAGQASALSAIGWARSQLGAPKEGLIDIGQAIQMQQMEGDRYGEAASYASAGLAHYVLRDFDQAISGYERSIELYRQVGRPMYVADKLILVGDAYAAAGRPDAARKAWQDAQDIYDELGVVMEDLARRIAEFEEITPAG